MQLIVKIQIGFRICFYLLCWLFKAWKRNFCAGGRCFM